MTPVSPSWAASSGAGLFSHYADVGSPKLEGRASYFPEQQAYLLEGAGYNIWFERDEFSYLYDEIDGDFILTANFKFLGEGADPHRKVGWMVRSSVDEDAPHMTAALHGDGLTVLQWRPERGASMRDPQDEIFAPKDGYSVLQLERSGPTFVLRAAHAGEPLQEIGSKTLDTLSGPVLAGLFVCSHDEDVLESAQIWNVRIEHPVPEDHAPWRDGQLAGRLETLDVFTGVRRVIHENGEHFEAPNWMPDGDHLLFNSDGRLYTIPLEGGQPTQLDTGFADRCNNDHGISFDGKLLAISHHRGDPDPGSAVYVLPLEGGTPQLVTEKVPSYWHGWAPNNREVVYVARRDPQGPFNIYRADVETREETQLTFFETGHVDGPEYDPAGDYIYYNGSQTGTMQIWRMKPDGSDREQLTFDSRNAWFPHVSPDGKWLLYLTYPASIDPQTHPANKRVTLKLMPLYRAGTPRTIAYLYGGQGTINVPSWSPDSRSVAFVSYTKP